MTQNYKKFNHCGCNYQNTPGIPVYNIGSLIFEKVAIDLPKGKTFRFIANKSSAVHKYIQRTKFDGKALDTPWFTYEQLVDGGKLELEPLPITTWENRAGFKLAPE